MKPRSGSERARSAPQKRTAVATVVALLAALLMFTASPADAAAQATFEGAGQGATVVGSSPEGGTYDGWAGEMRLKLDGGDTRIGYCIDILTTISNNTSGLVEQDWSSAVVQYEKIQGILNTYNSTTPIPGENDGTTRSQRAAGIQAAIWHYSDAFVLDAGSTNGNIVSVYNAILAAAADPNFGQPPELPSISVNPDDASGTTGQAVGPYTVATKGTVAVSADNGAVVLDGPGGSPLAQLTDGGDFWVRNDTAGSSTITIEGDSITVPKGRVFAKPGVQRLIIAQEGTAKSKITATAAWSDPAHASVAKTINGDDIPEGGFEFTLAGPGTPEGGETTALSQAGTVDFDTDLVLGESYSITETSTDGWNSEALVCRIGEQVAGQGDGSTVRFTVPQSASGETITCEFVNDQLYTVSVSKTVVTPPAGAGYVEGGEFDILWECSLGNSTIPGTTTVTDSGDPVVLSDAIPHGYTCEVTGETNLPTLSDGFSWIPLELTELDTITVPSELDTIEVTNEIADDRLWFEITKDIVGATDQVDLSDATFTVAWECTNGDTKLSGSTTISTEAPTVVDGIPAGYDCDVVDESDFPSLVAGFSWGEPWVNGPVEITEGGETIAVTNVVDDDRIEFMVVKELVNLDGSGVDDDTEFPVSVACEYGSANINFAGTISVNQPFSVGPVPPGSECTTTEGDLPALGELFEWGEVEVSPNPLLTEAMSEQPRFAPQSESVELPIERPIGMGQTVVVTNTVLERVLGSVEVTKTLAGDEDIRDDDVVVTLACGDLTETITIGPDESGPASVSIDGLIPGETCTVTELADQAGLATGNVGIVVATIAGAADTDSGGGIAAEVTIVEGSTEVEVTNTYTGAEVGGESEEATTTTTDGTTTTEESQVGGIDAERGDESQAAGAGRLPRTGTDIAQMIIAALAVALLGLGLVAVTGPRRRSVRISGR